MDPVATSPDMRNFQTQSVSSGVLVEPPTTCSTSPPFKPLAAGILVEPFATFSEPEWQVLGNLTDLRAKLSSLRVCVAARRAASMPLEERRELGRRARLAYLADKWQFEARIGDLKIWLACVQDRGRQKCAYLVP